MLRASSTAILSIGCKLNKPLPTISPQPNRPSKKLCRRSFARWHRGSLPTGSCAAKSPTKTNGGINMPASTSRSRHRPRMNWPPGYSGSAKWVFRIPPCPGSTRKFSSRRYAPVSRRVGETRGRNRSRHTGLSGLSTIVQAGCRSAPPPRHLALASRRDKHSNLWRRSGSLAGGPHQSPVVRPRFRISLLLRRRAARTHSEDPRRGWPRCRRHCRPAPFPLRRSGARQRGRPGFVRGVPGEFAVSPIWDARLAIRKE